MLVSAVIRRCLLPAATLVAEKKITYSEECCKDQENPQNDDLKCRPSELPFYTPEPVSQSLSSTQEQQQPNFIENSVRSVRQTVKKYSEEFQAYEEVAKQSLSESKQNVEWLVDYLRQEDNVLPKAGAIGIGALTGLIFGLRGGLLKKTIYGTVGALGMAAICYPKEASEYTQTGVSEGKKYLTIAYNFAYGVKKDEPPRQLPSIPKLPSNFTEIFDSIKSTAGSFISDPTQQNVEEMKNNNNKTSSPKK